MSKLCASASIVFLLIGAPSAAQAPADRVTAFVGVTVIPMDSERTLPAQTVIVRDDRIAALGPAAKVTVPEDAARVDGAGKFLLPALAEMHAHVPGGDAPDALVERTLLLYAVNGIGTIRSMLGHPRHLDLRARVAKGELFAPTIYTSGPSLNGTSAATKEAAIRMVKEQKAAGYDFLKIHPGLTRDVFDAMDAAADAAGIAFAGHVPADVGLARALEARYATIDHLDGYIEALARPGAPASQFFGINLGAHVDERRIPELAAKTRAAGVWIVPTETLLEHLASDEDPASMVKWPEMEFAPENQTAQIPQWIATKQKMTAGIPPADRAAFIRVRRRLIKALHDAGVGLLLGSDAPQMWNIPGFSIHRELEMYVAAGLTPFQALETGTRKIAEFYGTLETTGTVAPGKRADLVLLDANPLEDIRHTSRIAGVMLGGRWMGREAIDTALAAR